MKCDALLVVSSILLRGDCLESCSEGMLSRTLHTVIAHCDNHYERTDQHCCELKLLITPKASLFFKSHLDDTFNALVQTLLRRFFRSSGVVQCLFEGKADRRARNPSFCLRGRRMLPKRNHEHGFLCVLEVGDVVQEHNRSTCHSILINWKALSFRGTFANMKPYRLQYNESSSGTFAIQNQS